MRSSRSSKTLYMVLATVTFLNLMPVNKTSRTQINETYVGSSSFRKYLMYPMKGSREIGIKSDVVYLSLQNMFSEAPLPRGS